MSNPRPPTSGIWASFSEIGSLTRMTRSYPSATRTKCLTQREWRKSSAGKHFYLFLSRKWEYFGIFRHPRTSPRLQILLTFLERNPPQMARNSLAFARPQTRTWEIIDKNTGNTFQVSRLTPRIGDEVLIEQDGVMRIGTLASDGVVIRDGRLAGKGRRVGVIRRR